MKMGWRDGGECGSEGCSKMGEGRSDNEDDRKGEC